MSFSIKRGDIFWANLDPTIGVEIQKTRPVVILSHNVINERSQLVIVIPLTTNIARLSPSHVLIPAGEGGLAEDSKALTEQFSMRRVAPRGMKRGTQIYAETTDLRRFYPFDRLRTPQRQSSFSASSASYFQGSSPCDELRHGG